MEVTDTSDNFARSTPRFLAASCNADSRKNHSVFVEMVETSDPYLDESLGREHKKRAEQTKTLEKDIGSFMKRLNIEEKTKAGAAAGGAAGAGSAGAGAGAPGATGAAADGAGVDGAGSAGGAAVGGAAADGAGVDGAGVDGAAVGGAAVGGAAVGGAALIGEAAAFEAIEDPGDATAEIGTVETEPTEHTGGSHLKTIKKEMTDAYIVDQYTDPAVKTIYPAATKSHGNLILRSFPDVCSLSSSAEVTLDSYRYVPFVTQSASVLQKGPCPRKVYEGDKVKRNKKRTSVTLHTREGALTVEDVCDEKVRFINLLLLLEDDAVKALVAAALTVTETVRPAESGSDEFGIAIAFTLLTRTHHGATIRKALLKELKKHLGEKDYQQILQVDLIPAQQKGKNDVVIESNFRCNSVFSDGTVYSKHTIIPREYELYRRKMGIPN